MAKLGINTGSIPNDGTGDSLLAGAVKINSNFGELYTLLGDGTNLAPGIVTSIVAGSGITVTGSTGRVTVGLDPSVVGASGTWSTTTVGIHTIKNVGIGTTNPTQKLSVTGNAFITEFLGLGTASPGYPLHIRSNPGTAEPSIVVSPNTQTRPATIRLTNDSPSKFVLGLQDSSGNSDFSTFPAYAGVVGVTSANPLIFVTNSVEGFRLSENGNLGLNRNSPTSKLDVFGDVRISGVVTAASFVGSGVGLTGVNANYTSIAGVATYAGNAGVATYANTAGIATYANTAGVSTTSGYSNTSGVSTTSGYATLSGIATYATRAGVSTATESIDITNTNGLTTIYYPTFVENRTTGQFLRADVDLTYRTDTNTLTSGGGFVGNLTGTATTATVAQGLTGTPSITVGAITATSATFSGNIGVGTTNANSAVSIANTAILNVGIVTANTYYGDASYIVSGKWTITGDGYSFIFVGIGLSISTNDPVLYFARGCTYHIVNNDGDHPFEIRDQNGGTAYNNGVVGNGQTMTTIKFTVPLDAPNTLYYQCPDHTGMGNTIRIYPDRI